MSDERINNKSVTIKQSKMLKKILFITILVLVSFEIVSLKANRASSRSRSGPYDGSYGGGRRVLYGGQAPSMPDQIQPAQTAKEYLDQKSGFSTFGIISIIFAIIVVCLAFYYGVMCYPLLCRDEKKYRYMSDISSTITAATSRSIQSMENYAGDQKQ